MSFSTEKARQKLALLNNTQQSIQTTSQWCLFHYRHANDIVALWNDAFITPDSSIDQSESNYRLALFYLCNDLVQFAKKKESKYEIFLNEFSKIMPNIMNYIINDNTNAHLTQKYLRVLNVWKDRVIFPINFIVSLQNILNGTSKDSSKSTQIPIQSINKTVSSYHYNSNNGNNNNINTIHNNGINASILDNNNNNNINSSIPNELMDCVSKYNQLNQLYKTYKSNLVNFNKISNNLINGTNNENSINQEKKLSNILSSLSSLQNINNNNDNNKKDNNSNSTNINSITNNNDDNELEKFENTEKLVSQIENQSNKITELRTELAVELRKLASELDDWIMLDKGKQVQLKNKLQEIKNKKNSIIEERNKVSVFNYDNADNDDEIIPKYDDGDDDDDDSSDNGNNSDNDSDSNNDADADSDDNSKATGPATVVGSLRKRLLGESEDSKGHSDESNNDDADDDDADNDDNVNYDGVKRKKNKTVSFAVEAETRVFDKNESIGPIDAATETDHDEALDNILGLLQ
jgi:hypothetical protein